jgi:hypothetical protein
MPFMRSAYLNFWQADGKIQGSLTHHVFQTSDGQRESYEIPLSFYVESLNGDGRAWLKDVLVQVIEQL